MRKGTRRDEVKSEEERKIGGDGKGKIEIGWRKERD